MLLPAVIAGPIQQGKIRLEVINGPPHITEMKISPDNPRYDSTLECVARIKDEHPETVTFFYAWYSNGEKLSNDGKFLKEFEEEDTITCQVRVVDEGFLVDAQSADTYIQGTPLRVKLFKPILETANINVRADEVESQTSMMAVTGMVTGSDTSPVSTIFVLILTVIIIGGLNIAMLLKKKVFS